jgi:hypothetical protein
MLRGEERPRTQKSCAEHIHPLYHTHTNTSTKRKRVDPERVLHLTLLKQRVVPQATGTLYAATTKCKAIAIEQWHDLTTA